MDQYPGSRGPKVPKMPRVPSRIRCRAYHPGYQRRSGTTKAQRYSPIPNDTAHHSAQLSQILSVASAGRFTDCMQLSRSRRQSPSPPSACHTLIGMRESRMISIPSGCKFRKCGFCLSACCFWNPAGTRSLLAGAPPGLGNYAGIYGGMVRGSSETLAETGSNLACLGCFINSHFKRKVNY